MTGNNKLRFAPRAIPTTGDDRPASGIWGYTIRMSGWHQLWLCLLAVAVAGLNLIPIELQRRVIDDAITPGNTELLLTLAIFYGCVLLLHQALKYAMRAYQYWLSESAVYYTRNHLLGLYRDDQKDSDDEAGRAVSIIGSEVDKLGLFVGEGPSQACVNLAKLMGVIGYMAFVEPKIAIIGLLLLVPQAGIVPLMQKRLNMLIEKRLKYLRALGDSITAEEPDDAESRGLVSRIYTNHMAFYLWKFLMKSLTNLANAAAPLAILIWGGWLVIDGQTTIGVVVAFLSGLERISGPIRELLAFYRTVAQAQVQHAMIAKWM